MSWIPLSDRLSQLPLILAGPVLRRTESNMVTVWVALKAPAAVTLRIYATEQSGSVVGQQVLEGSSSTVAIGRFLHIAVITARSIAGEVMVPAQIYAYDLDLTPDGAIEPLKLPQALNAAGSSHLISYFNHQLPTFSLPPQDLNNLRIVHGSCRKLNGNGRDALPILDELIEQSADLPDARPHQLFMTGDQVYGDDVANPLLFFLTDAGSTLLGWEEQLPLDPTLHGEEFALPSQLKPGQRSETAEHYGGFTAGLKNKPDYAKSHLFSFGEYCTAYLFSWSPVLWLDTLPKGRELWGDRQLIKQWDREAANLQVTMQTLWKVRRALANVPTYMIFDDHDISDDWYLNQAWCMRVLGRPLGRRSVQNGLLAYALCQGWGNMPEAFVEERSGGQLLNALQTWSASSGTDRQAEAAIARYLGLPDSDPHTGLPKLRPDENVLILDAHPEALTWNYVVRSDRHEVIVLDTRTWRGYPTEDGTLAPPMLLCPSAFEQQIRQPICETDRLNAEGATRIEATFIVAPTNLVSMQAIDWLQHRELRKGKVFDNDVGDAWNIHKAAFAKLLATLFEQREQVMILSGDIHYGSVVRLNYWSRCRELPRSSSSELASRPANKTAADETAHVLAQLTASAIKNAEWKTRVVHTKLKSLVPEGDREFAGWNDSEKILEAQTFLRILRRIKLEIPGQEPIVQRILLNRPRNRGLDRAFALTHSPPCPDWRYRIDWVKRQPAVAVRRSAPWLKALDTPRWQQQLRDAIAILWQNRWLQEGTQVVGCNNLGVVSLDWTDVSEQRQVSQDLYWYPGWRKNGIVFSRFTTQLVIDRHAMDAYKHNQSQF